MTTRERICDELRKRNYPQTAAMLKRKIGKSTVQLLCRCLALERNIIERKVRDEFWYAWRTSQFKDWRIEYSSGARRGQRWKVLCYQRSERGALMLAAHAEKRDRACMYRVLYRSERVCGEFNNDEQKERQSWQDGKRILRQVRTMLRDPSSSRIAASTPDQTSPR